MSVYAKFFAQLHLFDCSKPLELYNCPNCKYTTKKKTLKSTYNCEFEENENQVILDQCKACKVGSVSSEILFNGLTQKESRDFDQSTEQFQSIQGRSLQY